MDQKKIGKYIADKRKALGMTQVSLADELDVSDKSVSKWERGICLPDASKYKDLCDILGITLNELFAGEDLSVENVIKQSERNLIWISRLGEVKNKRLFRIIIALIMCVIVLTAGFIWIMNQDKTLRGNYITAFSIENPDEAGLVFTFGDAAIFNYSLDESFENVTYEIVKYNNGKITDTVIKKTSLPDGRRQEDMIGIQDAIQDDKICFIKTMDGGSIGNNIPVKVTEDEKMLGYSYATLETPVEVEKGKKVLIYARLAGDIVQGYSLEEIGESPQKYLAEMECCILIYLTFE